MHIEEAKEILARIVDDQDDTYLDDFVHEAKGEEASAINNQGFEEQWEFLLMTCGADYLIELAVSEMDLKEWFANPEVGVRKDTGNGTFDLLVDELVFRQRYLGPDRYRLTCDQFPGLVADATTIRGCEDKLWNLINLELDNHVGQHLFKSARDQCPRCQAGDYTHVDDPIKDSLT